MSNGLTNRKIATQLTVAMSTVKWYVRQIYNKLGVENRSEAITYARQLKLLPEKKSSSSSLIRVPLQPTPFIGRKNELEELATLLADPTIRLITILGPGGMGKTRLSIEVAREQGDRFTDGIYFVSLAALDDAQLIGTAVAQAINFSFRTQEQQNKQLLAHLRDQKILLLLDNFEHLLEGVPFIADVLNIAPNVRILTTSRERLQLRAETIYTMDSMFVPEMISKEGVRIVESNDALQLFVTCAQRTQPQFEMTADNVDAVIAICQLVAGLPLGIELAAAWAGLLTPAEIGAEIKSNLDFLASHLQDMPDRQQSIRSVFESSWRHLTEMEQDVFQRLSVFRGGFTRQAAESVTGATLQILMALVNKSLVKPDYSGRYHLHELLRQYGREKLQEAGETEQTKDRHLAFFLKMAQEVDPYLWRSEQVTWINLLEIEHDNLRTALAWSRAAAGQAESGLLLAGSLAKFWALRGYLEEGCEHLSAALSTPEALDRTAVRAKALNVIAGLAYLQGGYPETRQLLEESISIYRELDPVGRQGLADALITLGDVETEVGEYAKASSLMKEGLGIMRELNDTRGIGRALWQLGACFIRPGDYEQATQYFEASLPLLRQVGDRMLTATALSGLAEIALRQGEYERATNLEEESLAMRREINAPWGIAVSLGNFAWIALCQDDLQQAATLLVESLSLRREIGDRGGIAWCLEKLAEVALIRGQQKSTSPGDEEFRRAARLFGAAQALRAPVNSTLDLVDRPEYERQVASVRAQFDEETFTAVWAEGQGMTLERVIEYALEAMAELPQTDF